MRAVPALPPVLVVLSGPPGVGKSTVADAVAALHPAVRLSIDDVEEAMLACGLDPDRTVPTDTAATALRAASVPAAGAQSPRTRRSAPPRSRTSSSAGTWSSTR
jgi:Mg-chelatase subunit ChlI